MAASTHDMPHDSPSNSASSEKLLHHASAIQISPLVECESIEIIVPLVQFEAAEHLNNDKLHHACSQSPSLQPPVELISLSDDLPPDRYIHSTRHSDIEYTPATDVDFNNLHSHSNPTRSIIEPSYKDLLCDECASTVPSIINMLLCDSCSIHVCGKCI